MLAVIVIAIYSVIIIYIVNNKHNKELEMSYTNSVEASLSLFELYSKDLSDEYYYKAVAHFNALPYLAENMENRTVIYEKYDDIQRMCAYINTELFKSNTKNIEAIIRVLKLLKSDVNDRRAYQEMRNIYNTKGMEQ